MAYGPFNAGSGGGGTGSIDTLYEEIASRILVVGSTAPETNSHVLFWIDTNTSTGGLKYYNGTAWVHVPVGYADETTSSGSGTPVIPEVPEVSR